MNRGRPRGFTLVEVLVAISVAGIVAVALHVVASTVTDLEARARAVWRQTAREAAVRRQLRDWLEGAAIFPDQRSSGFSGSDAAHAALPDDQLRFETLAPDPWSPATAIVRLFIDRDEATGLRGLVAEITHSDERQEALELVPEADGLEVRYLFRSGAATWLPSWHSLSQLPDALELGVRGEGVPPLIALPITVVVRPSQ